MDWDPRNSVKVGSQNGWNNNKYSEFWFKSNNLITENNLNL
jgi:hypothetical protein